MTLVYHLTLSEKLANFV